MKKLLRLTALIGVLVLSSGLPAYAAGGGHGGGGFGGGGHAGGGMGGGHGFGGSHPVAGGHPGFHGHHGGHHGRFVGGGFVGVGPLWDPYWGYWPYPYGPYAYPPAPSRFAGPPVYVEKPQAGYCPSGA